MKSTWRQIRTVAPSRGGDDTRQRSSGAPEVLLADAPVAETPSPTSVDGYGARLAKLIPMDVTSVYILLDRIGTDGASIWWRYGAFALCLACTPVVVQQFGGVVETRQKIVSTMAFAVWAFALGGPFALQDWYAPNVAAMLLVAYTFVIPLIWKGAAR